MSARRNRYNRHLLNLERLEDRTVPAAPVNSIPGAQSVIEETPLVFSSANGNGISFTDPDGPGPYQVELVIATNPGSATVAGALTVANIAGVTLTGNGTNALNILGSFADVHAALDTLTLIPAINLEGQLRLIVETHDDGPGGLADTDFINITVTPNVSPTNNKPGTQSTALNTSLAFSSANGNGLSITDPDGPGPFEVELDMFDVATSTRIAGTISLANTSGLTVTGNNSDSVTLVGSLADMNAALNSMVYHPATGYTGQARLVIETQDSDVNPQRSDTDFFLINVGLNQPPSNVILTAPGSVNENGQITVNGTFTNPDGDAHTVVIDFGDGSTPVTLNLVAGATSFSTSHTYLDDAPSGTSSDVKTITATVSDGVNSAQDTHQITVNNVAPFNISVSATPALIGENSMITVTFADPGTLDPKLIAFDFGDGSPVQNFGVAPGQTSFTTTHAFANPGTFAISATVSDDDLGIAPPAQTTVNIANPIPVLIPPVPQQTIEGSSTLFLLGTFIDANNSGNYTVTVNWGDGTSNTVFNQATAGAIIQQNHTFAQDGVFTVTITVSDADGTSAPVSFLASVSNVLPVAADAPDQNAVATIAKSFALGSFSDPGTDAPWSITVNWSDGSPNGNFTVNTPGELPPLTHSFATPGTFNVVVTVQDDDGSSTSDYLVTVIPPEAHVLGNVFRDFNRDGSFNTTDLGQQGVTVFADRNGNGLLDANEPSTVSDLNGNYNLTVNFEGAVNVRQVEPTGFFQTTDNPDAVNVVFGDTITVESMGNGRIITPVLVVGARTGKQPFVQVRGTDGTLQFQFTPFPTIKSAVKEVRLATGDANDDGIEDVYVVPGPGIAGVVKIFSGVDGTLLRTWAAYPFPHTKGLSIATSDINGDGVPDVFLGTERGASPLVTVWDGKTEQLIKSFVAPNASSNSGVKVAAGDVNGDGIADVITTPGIGYDRANIRIMAHDAVTGAVLQNFVVKPTNRYDHQLALSAADLNGDGLAEVMLTSTRSGLTELRTFDQGLQIATAGASSVKLRTSAFNLTAKDINGDGVADLLFAGASGQAPRLKAINTVTGQTILNALLLGSTQKNGLVVG